MAPDPEAPNPQSPSASSEAAAATAPLGWLVALLLGALFFRGWEAMGKSLWLDELHSLHAAAGASVTEVLERVSADFHPPGYFLLLHFFQGLSPHAQRGLSVLASLVGILPLWGLMRAARLSPSARLAGLASYAFFPYQLQYGAELRAYALLQTASLGLAWAAFTAERSRGLRFLVFALATAAGLYAHYFACLAVLGIGATRLVLRRPAWLSLPQLVGAGLLGVLAFSPWIYAYEHWVFRDFGLMFRADDPAVAEKMEEREAQGEARPEKPWKAEFAKKAAVVPLRLVVPRMGSLGGAAAWLARGGALALFGILVGCAWRACAAGRGRRPDPAWSGAMLAGVVAALLLVLLLFKMWKRVPLQYFVVAAWVWPLFVAGLVQAVAEGQRRRWAQRLCLAALVLGVAQGLGSSREDVRAGVARALELGERESAPLYTAVLWQPNWYPEVLPYAAYAPGVHAYEPLDLPSVRTPEGRAPVIVVTRDTWPDGAPRAHLWNAIKQGRTQREALRIDAVTSVFVFVPREDATR